MSTSTWHPAITHRELARMQALAELHDAGTLTFGALLPRLSTERTLEADIPLAPVLRILEVEGRVGTRTGHPRPCFLRPPGRAELHARAPPPGAAANRGRRGRPSGRGGDTFSGRSKNRRRDSEAAAADFAKPRTNS